MNLTPSYIELLHNNDLKIRAESALASLDSCNACPFACNVNRRKKEYGICTSGFYPIVSSYSPHFGEEPVLSGNKGAGNIFLVIVIYNAFIVRTTRLVKIGEPKKKKKYHLKD